MCVGRRREEGGGGERERERDVKGLSEVVRAMCVRCVWGVGK